MNPSGGIKLICLIVEITKLMEKSLVPQTKRFLKILGILKYTDIASPPYVNAKGDFHLGSVQMIFEKICAHAWNMIFEKIQEHLIILRDHFLDPDL